MAFPIVFGIINILIIDVILLNTGNNLTTNNFFTESLHDCTNNRPTGKYWVQGNLKFFSFYFSFVFFKGGGGIWCYNLRWLKIILCSF